MNHGQETASGQAEAERRVRYLEPLFMYLLKHHYVAGVVARVAGDAHGLAITSTRLSRMRHGKQVIPAWFVAECCAAIGKSVVEVMGAGWARLFGEDGRGGEYLSPVGIPRVLVFVGEVNEVKSAVSSEVNDAA